MNKHTKGPWDAVRSNPSDGYDCWYIANCEKELATVAGGAVTSEANARLIAAAPDLKALAVALDNLWTAGFPGGPDAPIDANGHFRLSDDTTALWRQCRAAIAKAEGRQ